MTDLQWDGILDLCIEEVTYRGFRGCVVSAGDPQESFHVLLRLNGVAVSHQRVEDNRFALNAHRDINPIDFVELVLLDSAGRHVRTSRWGDVGRSLPSAWIDKEHYRYPSVFVLGAAKSGTTSLHECLDQHPNVLMSKPKEPLFFEAEYARGSAFYFNKYFSGWRGEAVVGESRHRNLYLPYVAARIARYNPNAKLIALLRNPAERAVSHWWHWRTRNLEPLPAQAAFEADLERIQAGQTHMLPHEITTYVARLGPRAQGEWRTYLDSGYYSDQLERFLGYFSRDQLLIIPFEDLAHSPSETMRAVFRFLAVDDTHGKTIDCRPLNQSLPGMWDHISDATWRWLIEHYRSHNRRLEELLGRSFESWSNATRPVG